MKPALSLVFFTVTSGAGLGLLALTVLASALGLLADGAAFIASLAGAVLTAAGLASSTLHLATPKNAWRALARVATSWLSREAVAALALAPFVLGWLACLWTGAAGAPRLAAGLGVLALAWLTLWFTGMIYASLKPVPQWHTPLVPLNYLLLGHFSGSLLLLALAGPGGAAPAPFEVAVFVLLLGAGAAKVAYNTRAAMLRGPRVQSALGQPSRMRVKLLDAGHSHGTFLTSEFGFHAPAARFEALREAVFFAAFAAPLLLVLVTQKLAPLAALSCLGGLLVERWLFFAEARHSVSLYHGAAQV